MSKELSPQVEKLIVDAKLAIEKDDIEKVVCKFYQDGGCPDCRICAHSDGEVQNCRQAFLDRIELFPMEKWSEEFEQDVIFDREKVAPESVAGIGVMCDRCYMFDKCPLYKRGYTCGIDWRDSKPNSATEFMDFLINVQYERVKRVSIFEKVDGGVPDINLSSEMDRLERLVLTKANMGRERISMNLEMTGGGIGGEKKPGLLASIFGGANQNALPPAETKALPPSSEEKIETIEIIEPEKVESKKSKKKTKKLELKSE